MRTLRRHFEMTYYFAGEEDCGKRSVDEVTFSSLRQSFALVSVLEHSALLMKYPTCVCYCDSTIK